MLEATFSHEVLGIWECPWCKAIHRGPLKPGYPLTHGDHWCGQFRDEFDWSTLDRDYLGRVGALDHGSLKPKPRHARTV